MSFKKTIRHRLFFAVFVMAIQALFAQQNPIKGKVTDSDGQPLPGVTVVLQGQSKAVQTDFDGLYRISAKKGDKLVFSYMGMNTQTLTVSTTTLDVIMQESSGVLDEVVVTALGITRERKKLGYAVQSVKADKLNMAGTTNINNALTGKVSGVQFLGTSSADLDGAPNVRIRGVNTIGGGNPLYVVDGTPVMRPQDINMDDVAEISVLKGASASVLYGSRALNGVIIIKTKSSTSADGKSKTAVSITNNLTFSKLPRWYDTRFQNEYGGGYKLTFDTFQYDAAKHPASWASFDGQKIVNYAADESWGPRFEGQMVRHWDSWYEGDEFGKLRPWVKSPTQPSSFFDIGINNRLAVAVAKSGKGHNTRLSYTNVDVKGVLPNSTSQQNFLTLKTTLAITDKIIAEGSVNYTRTVIQGDFSRKGYSNPTSGMFDQWYQRQIDLNRLKKYKQTNKDGSVVYRSWNIKNPTDMTPLYWDSPYRDINENERTRDRHTLTGFVSLTYKITDKMMLKGVSRRNTRNMYLEDKRAGTRQQRFIKSASYMQVSTKEDNHEFLLTYNDKFLEDDLSVDFLGGGNLRREQYELVNGSTRGGLVIKDFYNLSASKEPQSATNRIANKEIRSFYGTLNLGYQDYLFGEVTFRSDWSSTLPKDNNNFTYPGVTTSFVFSEMFKQMDMDLPVISFGKLRGSWAKTGADTNPYNLEPAYTLSSTNFDGDLIQNTPSRQPNQNLKAALTTSVEVGLEMKFINNRLGFDFAYFDNTNTNQIINVPTTRSTGYSSTLINAGQITNQGWELSLNVIPIRTPDIDWSLDFNISRSVSMVDKLAPERGIKELYLGWYAYAKEGERYGVFKGDKPKLKNGKPYLYSSGNKIGRHVKETNNDKKYMDKNALPDFTGGFMSSFSYKFPNNAGRLNFNTSFDFQIGGTIIDINARYANHSGLTTKTVGTNDKGNPIRNPIKDSNGNNVTENAINAANAGSDTGGIRIEGYDEATGKEVAYYIHPKKYYHWNNIFRPYHNAYDASFVKLRELMLAYTLPNKLMEKLHVTSLSIGLVLRNVLLYKNSDISIDPSQASAADLPWISWGQLPSANTMGLNLNIKF